VQAEGRRLDLSLPNHEALSPTSIIGDQWVWQLWKIDPRSLHDAARAGMWAGEVVVPCDRTIEPGNARPRGEGLGA
jgi:hypothetical protein